MSTSYLRTDVMDPLTNIVDAYKELALLEDHLVKPARYCPDCIRKHLLKIEALGDECISLAGGSSSAPVCQSFALAAREWRSRLASGEAKRSVAKSVRILRKEIGRQIPVTSRLSATAGLPTLGDIPWRKWAVPVGLGLLAGRLLWRR